MPALSSVFSGIHVAFLVTVIIIEHAIVVSSETSITDISQVVIGNLVKGELDRLVKSVVITEIGSVVPNESYLVDISRQGSRNAKKCHTVKGQGAVLQELNNRNIRQIKWRQQVELQIRVIALFKNSVTTKLASETAKQDEILARLIQERSTLTTQGRNYDVVARKLDEARANKTEINRPLLGLVAACDSVTDNRNRLLEFIDSDINVLNIRRRLQETVVHRVVMSRICVGSEHACVITPESSIRCWGRCTEGQCSPPDDVDVLYRQVSCSDYSTCAVDNDDIVRCWGSDLFGIATPPAISFAHISMGSGHVCGIARNDSRVVCWGWNDLGQTDVPFNLTATTLSSSRYHSCALDVRIGVVCWGANRNNAAEPPTFLSAEGRFSGTFSAIAANLTDVSTSLYHSCVLGAQVNFLACWGAEGMSDGRASVPNGLLPISVSTGRSHTCTTNFNNALQCFGDQTGFGLLPSVRFAGAAAALNITCGIPLDVPDVVRSCGGGCDFVNFVIRIM
jgi:hypothetical protein